MNRLSARSISAAALVCSAVLSGCATTGSGTPDERFGQALQAMQADNYQRAEGLLVSINDREPDHAGVWANLGIVLSNLEREAEAVQALEQAIALNPKLAAAHNELGVLHRRAGRLSAAETAYQNALDADSGYASAHRNIGVLYDLYLGQPDKALEHYQRFIELDSTDEQVQRWIVELERRVAVREARNR
ncbi:MAG: tetratricopeptide repeat protein [Gammaproteobacteria bacterium]|nr:tetratricopeptide repeat protein [Gammaproteobacteria bacterium]NNF61779.1 tetratricopeptide repeat protein [Gammaproteobacteria bacterium]NNM20446.1 tetratricopeptide repeat protein [Gammaproteobacteria bacterium]